MKDLKETERVMKALANRRRLQIVSYLHKHGQKSVGAISHEIKLSFESTSRHLAVMSAANVLEREQTSTNVLYSLHQPLSPILKTTLFIL